MIKKRKKLDLNNLVKRNLTIPHQFSPYYLKNFFIFSKNLDKILYLQNAEHDRHYFYFRVPMRKKNIDKLCSNPDITNAMKEEAMLLKGLIYVITLERSQFDHIGQKVYEQSFMTACNNKILDIDLGVGAVKIVATYNMLLEYVIVENSWCGFLYVMTKNKAITKNYIEFMNKITTLNSNNNNRLELIESKSINNTNYTATIHASKSICDTNSITKKDTKQLINNILEIYGDFGEPEFLGR